MVTKEITLVWEHGGYQVIQLTEDEAEGLLSLVKHCGMPSEIRPTIWHEEEV